MQFVDAGAWARWRAPALSTFRIVLIVVLAWVLIAVLQRLVRIVRLRVEGRLEGTDGARRAETLGQSLVKDYFTGFFLLFEDQIRTGDVVEIADIGGAVEDITLRHVRLRDYDGNVHFIPNGLVTTVTNKSRSFAQSVVDVGVSYRENVDEVMALMAEVGAQLRADPAHAPRILADLEIAGVERLDDSAVVLRCRFKVAPLQQWTVRREFLRRLKAAFDAHGVEIPFPHLTLYAGVGKDGAAPALPLRMRCSDAASAGEPDRASA